MSGKHEPDDWELEISSGKPEGVFSEDPADYSEHLNELRESARRQLPIDDQPGDGVPGQSAARAFQLELPS
jgi:hypothetical protein